MGKKVYEKVEDIPKEGEEAEPEGLKDTDTLPSEAETKPESSGSESKKEEKPTKKKKVTGRIIGLMGIEHDPGPPGSSHG